VSGAAPGTGARPDTTPAGWARVARLADVADGALAAAALPDGRRVCLMRRGGAVLAIDDRCPHAEFPLSEGELLADGSVQCAWHGARFDLRTGALLDGPGHAPACGPVAAHDVLIHDGHVHVRSR
jgi:3-phenylpropionate/trans-cinnamate dioxygenase ferredoxin subunit